MKLAIGFVTALLPVFLSISCQQPQLTPSPIPASASVAPELVIEISPYVKEGEHTFGIDIEIDGKNYGTIPYTIEVIT